jgi:hypothetical protein
VRRRTVLPPTGEKLAVTIAIAGAIGDLTATAITR